MANSVDLASAESRAAAIVEIGQVMSLFAVLLDSHDYKQLGRVFLSTASADWNYPGVPVCEGLDAIITRLEDLKDAPSMMAISTQYVDLRGPTTAHAVTYITGNMFTPGWKEPSFTEYGRYYTDLVLTENGWRVEKLVAREWAVFDKWIEKGITKDNTDPRP